MTSIYYTPLSIGTIGTNFSEISITLHKSSVIKNVLKNEVCKMASILFRPQYVKPETQIPAQIMVSCCNHLSTYSGLHQCNTLPSTPLSGNGLAQRWTPPSWGVGSSQTQHPCLVSLEVILDTRHSSNLQNGVCLSVWKWYGPRNLHWICQTIWTYLLQKCTERLNFLSFNLSITFIWHEWSSFFIS